MRLFVTATVLALACAATTAAQSGRRVKPAGPAASPTPEQQGEPLLKAERQDDPKYRLKRGGEDAPYEPELDEEGNRVYLGRQVDRKARLLSRPEPAYPRRARRDRVRGTVVLRVVLEASGKVGKITVVKGLPEGVTEEAIRAARAIKFEPAERDGRKVSQSVVIEYNFSIY